MNPNYRRPNAGWGPLSYVPSILGALKDEAIRPKPLVVDPSPGEYLLPEGVAYDFLLGLRGSDLYADKWQLSLTSPEVALYGNLMLALVSALRKRVTIHVYFSRALLTKKGVSVLLTNAFYSAETITECLSPLFLHRKYELRYLEGYTKSSFLGHWIGDKYCRLNSRKNILDLGYAMLPCNLNYVDNLVQEYVFDMGGRTSDSMYDRQRGLLIIRGEARRPLIESVYNFYEKLKPLGTRAVDKIFEYIAALSRYGYAGLNIKPLPEELCGRILKLETKQIRERHCGDCASE